MAEAYLSETPEHIVVFREIVEKNISTLAKVLDVKEAPGLSARASCSVLQPSHETGIHTRVYRNLGVAATTLSEDQKIALEKQDDIVEAVFPNQIRCIPQAVGEYSASNYGSNDPLDAYLYGMRDAIEAVQRFRQGVDERTPLLPIAPQALSYNPFWSWCLDMIGVSQGYTAATGRGVKVAVLDTGIDLYHPDFEGRFLENDNTKSFIPDEIIHDVHGHGTHCTGIIAGPLASVSGKRYSVAPEAELVIVKVLNNQGYGIDDQIIEAMDWSLDNCAKVISMSLGSKDKIQAKSGQPYSMVYERIASVLLSKGTLVIAAAGNDSARPNYVNPVDVPAACPSIMGVAAIDSYRQVARFSCAKMSSSGMLDLSAPGVGVYSSCTGKTFKSSSGTSMATPHVAGVAALYFELYPHLSAREIWDRMVADALPLGNPEDYGHGLIQAPILEA